ncbi:MAG: protoporphyrinogen oxidase [Aquificae bacterium]|nr:protoporphyrinogen oxidase [Aquificota bacterium]
MRDVLVVGAGIGGLSVAYELKKRGYDVVLYEKEQRAGGSVESVKREGFLFERGPQTILADEEILSFFKELGLEPLEASPVSKRRFIYKGGKLVELPSSPPRFLLSPLLSIKGKLSILKDLFQKPEEEEVSVGRFVRKHFGEEFLRYVVAPFLSGVWAGDPEKLSLKYATPKLYELQRRYGSLIRAFLKERRFFPRGKLVSFRGGLSELIEALSERTEPKTESVVLRIRRHGERFKVDARGGKEESRSVVITTPAYTSSYLLKDLSFSASEILESVDYPPVVVVNVGVKGDIPEGFGFLVPRGEGLRILGAMFMSKLFPGRAPEGWELLSVFLGGATDRDVVELGEEQISKIVEEELRKVFPLSEILILDITKHKRAIPQYNLGHGRFLELSRELEEEHPGLFLAGNWLGGISAPDRIRASRKTAKRVDDFLQA